MVRTEPAPLAWRWLGRVPYRPVLEAQRAHRDAILAGTASDELWLLEHLSVVTVGRRPAAGTPSAAMLSSLGVDYCETERGGLATWHGPGQLVAYVLVDAVRMGPAALVASLEGAVIRFLDGMGLRAARRPGLPGVWVGRDKICAIGLHLRKGVSMHGLALNLAPVGPGFELIVPCGVADGGITSVAACLGASPSAARVAPDLAVAIGNSLGREVVPAPPPAPGWVGF